MPQSLPPGPYETLEFPGVGPTPWYILPFDKRGRSRGPRTTRHMLDALRDDAFTDVFVFSHGWNNDWLVATDRYRGFFRGFSELRRQQDLPRPAPYKPLLVGIFWPSTALVFGEERGPGFAAAVAGGAPERDVEVGAGLVEVDEVAEALAEAGRADEEIEEFYEFAQKESLTGDEAKRLAAILAPLYAEADDPEAIEAPEEPGPEDLLNLAREFGKIAGGGGPPAGGGFAEEPVGTPEAAGLGAFDPRNLIRPFTVWKMKDRAGVVGAHGVGSALRDLMAAAPGARVHLVGHSYGARVVLSALASGAPPRQVDSVLLLQPAVNQWCFADDVAGERFPGGYHQVPERCRLPVATTFSRHDKALRRLFHLAVRRERDLGEVEIAADGDEAPSRFAALGGYGPAGHAAAVVDVRDPLSRYPELAPGARPGMLAVCGDRTISGHGDISNVSTWWLMHELAARSAGL